MHRWKVLKGLKEVTVPVATGRLHLADQWQCTNTPMLARGEGLLTRQSKVCSAAWSHSDTDSQSTYLDPHSISQSLGRELGQDNQNQIQSKQQTPTSRGFD